MKTKIIIIIGAMILVIVSILFYCYENVTVPLSARDSYLNTTQYLIHKAKAPLERMIADAEKDGMCLVVISGYRTPDKQQQLYNEGGHSLVALPSRSEHVKGIAVDLGGCPMVNGVRDDSGTRLELKNDFDTLPEYQWLLKNAGKYGFAQSYTEENFAITGTQAEPWHWRYNKIF